MKTKIVKYFLSISAFINLSIAGFLIDVRVGFITMGILSILYFIVYATYVE